MNEPSNSIRVGIDVSSVVYGRGVSRYTANLVVALLKRPDLHLSLYGSAWSLAPALAQWIKKTLGSSAPLQAASAVDHQLPLVHEWLWRLGQHGPEKHFSALDIFHSWDWIQPPLQHAQLVSTIHDLAILKYPDLAHPKVLRMHQRAWKHLRQHAAHIIAVSEATKRDCVQLLGFSPELITVIHEAVPQEFIAQAARINDDQRIKVQQKLCLDRPYILFVGTREPRKNLGRLLQAWEPLSSQVDLIIAGESGWDGVDGNQISTIAQSHLRFLGKVSDVELIELYRRAEIFVYPSIDEGFGLPILEAFHCGTPVVAANTGGMPEVGGNAVRYVNPLEVESIREGMLFVLAESVEAAQRRRQQMVLRNQLFSWENVANATTQVYHRVLEERK